MVYQNAQGNYMLEHDEASQLLCMRTPSLPPIRQLGRNPSSPPQRVPFTEIFCIIALLISSPLLLARLTARLVLASGR
jgi:hypothetical protein